ncbi:MAG: hypothetical protein ACR2J6_06340 [Thermoleophilaceae bacterium]
MPASATASEEASRAADADTAGPAHVATVSFLASRAVPSGGFLVALAGGTALARVAQRHGYRQGYGASLAAMLETVAIMGPARFGVPLTQALSAPLLGGMHAREWGVAAQVAVCGLIRVLTNTAGVAFFIFVITGGLDAYSGAYENLAGLFGIELGQAITLAITVGLLVSWTVAGSVAQVLVYRRGLLRWPEEAVEGMPPPEEPGRHTGRFDPRAATVAAAIAFVLLLSSTRWSLVGAVVVWLALAAAFARADWRSARTGFVIAAVLATGALVFSLTGGLGAEVALQRALRAGLLVLTATWLRAAAGAEGLREVFRRTLGRMRPLPGVVEAIRVLDHIGSEGHLARAGRSLVDLADKAPLRPKPLVDAVLAWVFDQAGRFRPATPPAAPVMRTRLVDVALVVAAASPGVVLFALA